MLGLVIVVVLVVGVVISLIVVSVIGVGLNLVISYFIGKVNWKFEWEVCRWNEKMWYL